MPTNFKALHFFQEENLLLFGLIESLLETQELVKQRLSSSTDSCSNNSISFPMGTPSTQLPMISLD
jgi:hypothetical protein